MSIPTGYVPPNTTSKTDKKKKCKFKLREDSQCDKPSLYQGDYCQEHSRLKCWCGSQATHICYERYECQTPLCDNQYCSVEHNLKSGHVRTIHQW